ncbi:MAG TPA: glutamate 5-kinase [Kofleriaceae bacterium]|nr:glutamate 5-kinase [Kofleriaceae bacterium]
MASDAPATTGREALVRARRIVIKVGSRLVSDSPVGRPAAIADEVAALRTPRGRVEVVVVSSGAIALGRRVLGMHERPRDLPTLQAAAAVGQTRLMQSWEQAFAVHGLHTAQVLLTHDDLSDRRRFLNARHALRALLDAGVVPIINENDTVAVDEIRYGDNDLLAALVCNLISADALIILTDVDGLHDAPPADGGRRIPLVPDIDVDPSWKLSGADPRGLGSGGMASKVQAARSAARHGVATAVVAGARAHVLRDALAGADLGTLFVPSRERMSSRKHWIAYGARPHGRLVVDDGAHRAVAELGKSLLPAGIAEVEGAFDMGDIVSLATKQGLEFARGLAGYGAADLRRLKGLQSADIESTLGYKYLDEVIHRDDLVLL